jgi:hypothetical protein
MPKRTIYLIGLLLVILGVGVYVTRSRSSAGEVYPQEKSREVAQTWITEFSPTYKYDGFELSLKDTKVLSCQSCYEFIFSFQTRHGGYGDRSGKTVPEIITPHVITVIVADGQVSSAITDDKYDEIRQVLLVANSPRPSGGVIITNPSPSPQGNIHVTSPAPNQEILVPLSVTGEARVFENTIQIRLRDENGDILVEDTVTAQSPDIGQFGPFSDSLSYPAPKGTKGTVEVFDYSAKDGSEIDKVTIPVVFKAVETTTLQVYFANPTQDPELQHCDVMYPVARRVPKSSTPGNLALAELLKGPTKTDKDNGFFTAIPEGVGLKKLTIEGGVAFADFTKELNQNIGGSCRVMAIRAQIASTLKQFPTVTDVIISVEGQTNEILQP